MTKLIGSFVWQIKIIFSFLFVRRYLAERFVEFVSVILIGFYLGDVNWGINVNQAMAALEVID